MGTAFVSHTHIASCCLVACSWDALSALRIRRVVDASLAPDCRERWRCKGVKYMTIEIEDSEDADMAQHLPAAVAFILDGLKVCYAFMHECALLWYMLHAPRC
jgi:hypothetical protein